MSSKYGKRAYRSGHIGDEEVLKWMVACGSRNDRTIRPDKGTEVGQPSWVPSFFGSFVLSLNITQ